MANYNYRLVKINRSYTYEELAGVFGVHKNTVASWVKNGLPCLSERRPYLVLGVDAREYLQEKRTAKKRKCGVDEMFCVSCKVPSKPAERIVEYQPLSPTNGCIKAICSHCGALMNRFVSHTALADISRFFDISVLNQEKQLKDSNNTPLNSGFKN